MNKPITSSLLNGFLNKKVEIHMLNSMKYTIKRKGFLKYDKNWYYLYDEGKTGNEFNVAIHKNDIEKIIVIFETT